MGIENWDIESKWQTAVTNEKRRGMIKMQDFFDKSADKTIIKILHHGDHIKIKGWLYHPEVIVFTIGGCVQDNNKKYKSNNSIGIAETEANNHKISLAFTRKIDDSNRYDLIKKNLTEAENLTSYNNAIVLVDGDEVEIEHLLYCVEALCSDWVNLLDPIHFNKVQ